MAKRSLEVVITGDSRSAQKAFTSTSSAAGKAQGSVSKLRAGLGGLAKNLVKLGAVGAVGAIAGLGLLGKSVFNAGVSLEAVAGKSATVFGDSLPIIEGWAKGSAKAMGLSSSELTGLAANFGDLLIPMGFTRDAAADMAKTTLNTAGALAEWSKGKVTTTQASEILAKAMLGERDGLKSLGISINEADVKARLAAKGQDKLTGAALQQAKALATQELILEKSTDAQDAYAAGGFKLTRSQNVIKGSLKELRDTMAKRLLPIFAKVAVWLTAKLVPAFEKASDWLSVNMPVAIDYLSGKWEEFGPTVLAILGDVSAFLSKDVPKAFSKVKSVAGPILSTLGSGLEKVGGFVSDNRDLWPLFAAALGGAAIAMGIYSLAASAAAVSTALAVAPITLVVVAIGLLAGALVAAYFKFEEVRTVVDTVAAAIATAFTTAVAIVSAAWELLRPILDGIWLAIRGLVDLAVALFQGDWSAAWAAMQQIVSGVWAALTAAVPVAWALFTGAIGLAFDALGVLWSAAWDGFKAFVADTWEGIKTDTTGAIDAIIGFIGDMPGSITSAASGLFDSLWTEFKGVVNSILQGWNNISFSVPSFSVMGKQVFDGFTLGVPNVPLLAKGGNIIGAGAAIIGEKGPELLELPRGARVSPLSKTNSGNNEMSNSSQTIIVELNGSSILEAILSAEQSGGTVRILGGL